MRKDAVRVLCNTVGGGGGGDVTFTGKNMKVYHSMYLCN